MKKIKMRLRRCEECLNLMARPTKLGKPTRLSPKKYLARRFCSGKCRGAWHSRVLVGVRSSNYRHGLSSLFNKLRGSEKYKEWRNAVLKRDNWTCKWCEQRGGNLEVDHFKPFALFSEKRFEVANGRTLCSFCHKNTITYGMPIKAMKQFYAVI